MRVPKYIEKAMERRAKAIDEYYKQDAIVCKWLDKHNIKVDDMHIASGVESLCNPWSSYNAILMAIETEGE